MRKNMSEEEMKSGTGMKINTILAVDDNEMNLQIIANILKKKYAVMLAQSGGTGLKFIEKKKPDLILLDLMMPEMDGKETFRRIRQNPENRDIPIIFLTADDSVLTETECLEIGASDYITKPIMPRILLSRIGKTIELAEYQHHLQDIINEKTRETESLALQAIAAIANAIDAKDEETNGHSKRVAEYSRAIAREMGFDENECAHLYETALLHDVGKIGIPDAILKKDGRLTPEEYEIIKTHTTIGGDILSAITTIEHISDGARCHHERYDGTGYPCGLSGENIPLVARIIAVADVYDALTSHRCYKPEMNPKDVRKEIEEGSGTQFDPKVIRAFHEVVSGFLKPSP